MFDLQYNVAVQINERQYKALWKDHCWQVALRSENGEYFVKLWRTKYKNKIEECLVNNS
jgi:hypothetical protein